MRFTKMHGLGNDFVVVEQRNLPKLALEELAVRVCDRNFGIGADGLVILGPGQLAPWLMRIFNADGSEAEMCGNALRCVGKYLYQEGLVQEEEFTLESYGQTLRPLHLRVNSSIVTEVTVDMGEPIFNPELVPVKGEGERVVEQPLSLGEQEFLFTAVSMGNPHCVIFHPQVKDVPLEQWGPAIEHSPLFPNKTNVEFVEILAPDHALVRVWERGVGPTLACGSGACAVLAAGVATGKLARQAKIQLPGGNLTINWREDNRMEMSGPAVKVFSGFYEI